MFFRFPDGAVWASERQAVEFEVGIGEYEGVARIGRRVFQRLVNGGITPEACVEAYHLNRTRFERIAERKLRHRQVTDDGNVEITGRDLSERGGLADPRLDRVA
jgi:hypothetical protein